MQSRLRSIKRTYCLIPNKGKRKKLTDKLFSLVAFQLAYPTSPNTEHKMFESTQPTKILFWGRDVSSQEATKAQNSAKYRWIYTQVIASTQKGLVSDAHINTSIAFAVFFSSL